MFGPKSKVPTLERDDGSILTEFPVIARWLALKNPQANLIPKDEETDIRAMEVMEYVVEHEGSWKLLGVIALRSLILGDPDAPLAAVMREEFQAAHPDDSAKEVAQKIAEYNLLALPVVDDEGDIAGIVTVDDAMELLLPKGWRQRLPKIF